jgi:L-alanine-DL-glutamate epimerase-like enolase superfamily enzyme
VEIQTAIHQIEPRDAFRIARKRSVPFANVFLRAKRDGITGWGEASPNPFYGVSAESVSEKLHATADWLCTLKLESIADLEQAWADSWTFLAPDRAAQCALDLALWDWLAKYRGLSVCELALGRPAQPVTSFATIGLSTPEEFAAKLAVLRGYPRIKIKSDAQADLEPVRQAKAALGSEIAIDANCAWAIENLNARTGAARTLGVSFIEQPLPPEFDFVMIRGACTLPFFADESCVGEEDVDRLSRHFDGINVKLVKCGGLREGLKMIRIARECGLKIMVGCMIESSLLISAAAQLTPLVDYADLDGNLLIADDPFRGVTIDKRAKLILPDAAGIGVVTFNSHGE